MIKSAKGAMLTDADGKQYIDYVGSWGPWIAGHAHPHVIEKVKAAMQNGLSFGESTELEYNLTRLISKAVPTIDK